MSGISLSPLQLRVLEALESLEPPFVLTGGGALAGVHLKHRTTRDLDLFWRGRRRLDSLVADARGKLEGAGIAVEDLRTAESYHRLRVSDGSEVTIIDLVADAAPTIEAAELHQIGAANVQVDSRHEILVNKLCTLLGRAELRDLQDLKALLEAGEDLEEGLRDAPRKDGGFSPPTLAWVLRSFPVELVAQNSGWDNAKAVELARFRDELVERLVALSAPE